MNCVLSVVNTTSLSVTVVDGRDVEDCGSACCAWAIARLVLATGRACCRRMLALPIGVISPLLTYVFHARCPLPKMLFAPPPAAKLIVFVIVFAIAVVMPCHAMP